MTLTRRRVNSLIIISINNFHLNIFCFKYGIFYFILKYSTARLVSIGALPGTLISGFLMTWIGQKKLLLLAIPLEIIGWLGKAFAYNLLTLQLSRLLLDFSHGLVNNTVYNYITEITHSSLRGRMTALIDISRQMGILYVFAIGNTSLSWREIAIVCAVTTTVIPFIGLFFIHD